MGGLRNGEEGHGGGDRRSNGAKTVLFEPTVFCMTLFE